MVIENSERHEILQSASRLSSEDMHLAAVVFTRPFLGDIPVLIIVLTA